MSESILRLIQEAALVLEDAEKAAVNARGIRDVLIRDARRRKISLRKIGEAAGIHYTAVLKVERGGSR